MLIDLYTDNYNLFIILIKIIIPSIGATIIKVVLLANINPLIIKGTI